MEVSDLARSLAKKANTPTEAPKQEATAPEPPKTEEAQAPSEAQPEEPKEDAQAESTEPEGEANEVLSTETHSLDPKLQAKIDRRIGKEVAKRKALEQEVAALKQLVAQPPQVEEKEVVVPVSANVPLPEIRDLQTLQTYENALKRDIREAEVLLYSDFPAEGKQTRWGTFTKDQLIQELFVAKQKLEEEVPAKKEWLNTNQSARATALEKFDFLKDPTKPEYQLAQQAKRQFPVINQFPNSDMLIGLLIKGQQALAAEEAQKGAVKSTAKPKPKPTNGQSEMPSDASASRVPVGLMDKMAMEHEKKQLGLKKGVSQRDFAAFLAKQSQLRNSR